MNLILFDDYSRENLLPLTYTRPVSELRIGIMTIREKWEKALGVSASYITENYLSAKYPLYQENNNLLINGSVCPSDDLLNEIKTLDENQKLVEGDVLLAIKLSKSRLEEFVNLAKGRCCPASLIIDADIPQIESHSDKIIVRNLWDLFSKNGAALINDYQKITKGRTSEKLSSTNQVLGNDIFVEEGVKAECVIFNTSTGPIYLGKNTEVMEGSIIRGPFALCEGAGLKLGAKIYGPTTIGPHSKVGGEVNNSVILGYSNKGHDGFLGNSVIGEWCNLGADTNNSNLKNNYGEVQIWNYRENKFKNTGLQFCGLIMGDHSKCGINTMFNTGTVVGVNANVFGAGFPEKHIPSFSWGGAEGFETYSMDKAFEVAQRVFERRGKEFNDTEKNILQNIFELSSLHRK